MVEYMVLQAPLIRFILLAVSMFIGLDNFGADVSTMYARPRDFWTTVWPTKSPLWTLILENLIFLEKISKNSRSFSSRASTAIQILTALSTISAIWSSGVLKTASAPAPE